MFTARRLIALFWLASIITLVVMVVQGPAAWDASVYWTAIKSVHRGGDPYAEGITAQTVFHNIPNKDPRIHPPMTYVYSPITLPVLRALGELPDWLLGAGYYLALVAAFILQLWAGFQMASTDERRWLPFLLPAVAYFPGLLNADVILSANVAYLIHGLVLAAAVPGWKRNRWGWFYAAVLAASICKAPLLTLLAFPVIIGRRQWLPAAATGAAGLALFAAQTKLWPILFAEYMTAVKLQFDWNKDFGFGPAGVLGQALQEAGIPYEMPSEFLYLGFAVVLALTLLWISKRIGTDQKVRESWVPVVVVGTFLLNPRVKEYDVAALTVPLVLIWGRFIKYLLDLAAKTGSSHLVSEGRQARELNSPRTYDEPRIGWSDVPVLLGVGGWFVLLNIWGSDGAWKPTELGVLITSFAVGTWLELRPLHAAQASAKAQRSSPLRFERELEVASPSVDVGVQ